MRMWESKEVWKGALEIIAPFDEEFLARARALGGQIRFAQGLAPGYIRMEFPPSAAEQARRLAEEFFGPEGGGERTCTLRVFLAWHGHARRCSEITLAGRLVARRPHRDARVRLGPGVRIVSGGFARHGWSRRCPDLAPEPGTILEIQDVPETIARRAVARPPEWAAKVEIVN